MGQFRRFVFGTKVDQADLDTVLEEWGAQRQEELDQWWVWSELPLGGLWLPRQDPSVEPGYFGDRTLDEVTRALGCKPESVYGARLAGFLEESFLVAYALAHRCSHRWPCVVVDDHGEVTTAEMIARLVALPPTIYVDLVLADPVSVDDLPQPLHGESFRCLDLDWYDWGGNAAAGLSHALGREAQAIVALEIPGSREGAAKAIEVVDQIRRRWPVVVADRIWGAPMTVEQWQGHLKALWTWG